MVLPTKWLPVLLQHSRAPGERVAASSRAVPTLCVHSWGLSSLCPQPALGVHSQAVPSPCTHSQALSSLCDCSQVGLSPCAHTQAKSCCAHDDGRPLSCRITVTEQHRQSHCCHLRWLQAEQLLMCSQHLHLSSATQRFFHRRSTPATWP